MSLRRAVVEALDGAPENLPSHVTQKVEERISSAAKKNPTLDVEYYKTLDGKLEYCDLREVQDIISNKSLWPLFQSRLANKEMLAARFSQLAELRNSIRHSRTVDEVTRKDGEAATLWFQQVLAQ